MTYKDEALYESFPPCVSRLLSGAALCCILLQCVALCCSVSGAALCCMFLKCVALCCSMLQCEYLSSSSSLSGARISIAVWVGRMRDTCCRVLQCVSVCFSVLQSVAVCFTV